MSRLTTDAIASANDLATALKHHYEGLVRSLRICFPAFVTEYDRHSHKATVQPLVKGAYFDGKWNYIETRPIKVAVRSIQQGGFTIDMPVFIGDTGWVITSDRDTTLLKQDGALTNSVLDSDRDSGVIETSYEQKPHQPTMHTPEDGFFIPDNWGVFDYVRFKDSTYVDVGGSLYIGNSFDTADQSMITKEQLKEQALAELGGVEEPRYGETERQAKEREKKNAEKEKEAEELAEERVEKYEKLLQHGTGYLSHTTSSLVVEKGFGVHLLSTPKGSGKDARVSAKQNKVEMSIEDNSYGSTMNATVGVREGIRIEARPSNGSELRVAFSDGVTSIQIGDAVKLLIRDGNLCIECLGGVDLNTGGGVSLSADKGASIVSGATNVVCSGDVVVSAKKNVSVESNGFVSCFCGGDMDVKSGDDIEMQTDGIKIAVGGNFELNAGNDLDINLLDGSLDITDMCRDYGGSGVEFKADSEIGIETAEGETRLKLASNMEYSSDIRDATFSITAKTGDFTGGKIDVKSKYITVTDFIEGGVINQDGEFDTAYEQTQRGTVL